MKSRNAGVGIATEPGIVVDIIVVYGDIVGFYQNYSTACTVMDGAVLYGYMMGLVIYTVQAAIDIDAFGVVIARGIFFLLSSIACFKVIESLHPWMVRPSNT